MHNSERIAKLVRPLIAGLKPYSSARDEYDASREAMVFLDANENPFESDVNRYPDPHQQELRQLIASLRGVSEKSLILGNGSDDLLDLIFRVFCEPYTDQVICLPPTFAMYRVLSQMNGVQLKEVPLDAAWQPDVDAILKASGPETKILFLCSPNNPTGQSLDKQRVLELLQAFPGLVVIDEAYVEFADDPGFAQYLREFDNLVITQTLSKAYGLAGIRLGVCMAHPQVIDFLKRAKLPYNINLLTQQRALAALQNTTKLGREVALIRSERLRMEKALAAVPFIGEVFPSDANFLLVRVDDAALRYRQLIERGVVVRNTSRFLHLQNTLRFTIGRPEENDRVLEILTTL
ncbi:MAG TPA: histidinol-phosphate transaminase [Robiginitalea sp.]|nr:histidinol-phosphate transaminase [Robiginitalea sp.]